MQNEKGEDTIYLNILINWNCWEKEVTLNFHSLTRNYTQIW